MTIPKQYITEAERIRKIYLSNMKEIVRLEKFVDVEKDKIVEFQKELESIIKDPDLSDVRKTLTLNNRLLDIERSIKKIQDSIKPYYENIESLRGDADRLYIAIKEKYPNISKDDIQTEIMKYVK